MTAIIPTYTELHTSDHPAVIFRCITGSRAYGTHNDQSDTDIRGIFVLPAEAYLSLSAAPDQVANDSSDIVYYSLRRFLQLASAANPNFLELLFMPEDCILHRDHVAEKLTKNRELFVTQQAYESHVAYASAQIKRSRGQNKWVNNPKAELPPTPEQFCWFIPRETAQWNVAEPPMRPIGLSDAGIDLSQCHVSAVEHCPGLYRLYHIGLEAHGVLRNGQVVCESIPLGLEPSCMGLLFYNRQGFESEMKDHTHYWRWRESRNASRWLTQERGETDYDAKNLMHTFRLLLSAESIFRDGKPRVRFEGESLQFLFDIRNGKFSYDELMAMAEAHVESLEKLRASSSLPLQADTQAVEDLLLELTDRWSSSHRNG